MKLPVLVFGLVGLIAVQAAAAEVTFAMVDTDRSELISIEEVEAAGLNWSAEQFAAADTDADDYLNEEEFQAAIAQ